MAPAGTPKEVVETLHRTAVGALNDAEVRKALTDLGVDVVANNPEQLRAYIKAEIPQMGGNRESVGRQGGLRPVLLCQW